MGAGVGRFHRPDLPGETVEILAHTVREVDQVTAGDRTGFVNEAVVFYADALRTVHSGGAVVVHPSSQEGARRLRYLEDAQVEGRKFGSGIRFGKVGAMVVTWLTNRGK